MQCFEINFCLNSDRVLTLDGQRRTRKIQTYTSERCYYGIVECRLDALYLQPGGIRVRRTATLMLALYSQSQRSVHHRLTTAGFSNCEPTDDGVATDNRPGQSDYNSWQFPVAAVIG